MHAPEATYAVELDVSTPDGLGQTRVWAPVLLPHEVFGAIHDNAPSVWKKNIVGEGGCSAAEFWQRMSQVPYMAGHLVTERPASWPLVVPLGMHGDAAAFTKLDKMLAVSFNSVLCPGGSHRLDSRFLLAAVPTTWLLHQGNECSTIHQLCEVLAWSSACLLEGVYPAQDHRNRPWPAGSVRETKAGKPIADGICAAFVDFRGDWQHQVQFWGVAGYNDAEMCWECTATLEGALAFSNFNEDAPHARAAAARTTAQYLREHPLGRGNPLAHVPGWRLQFIKWDETHAVKLGVGRWAVASAQLSLCGRGHFGPPPLEDQLSRAWVSFRSWRRLHSVQCTVKRFTRSRLGVSSTDFPESSSKAWNTRVLVAWLSEQCAVARDVAGNDHNRMLALCMHSMHSWFCSMEACKHVFFEDADKRTFLLSGRQMLAAYHWLAADSLAQGVLRWPLRPKHHAVFHLLKSVALDARNPKRFGTIMDEDLLGKVVKVAAKCHRRTVAEGVVFRYIVNLARRWRGLQEPRRLRIRLRPRLRRRPVLPLPPRL